MLAPCDAMAARGYHGARSDPSCALPGDRLERTKTVRIFLSPATSPRGRCLPNVNDFPARLESTVDDLLAHDEDEEGSITLAGQEPPRAAFCLAGTTARRHCFRANPQMRVFAAVFALSALVLNLGCDMLSATATPGTATASQEQCRRSVNGEEVCGYDCMMDSQAVFHCADTPDGSCSFAADGSVTCTKKAAESPPPQTTPETLESTDSSVTGSTSTTSTVNASCCVNGAFYECPDANAVGVCLGQPMQLMSCADQCPMMGDGACEEECISNHGPHPEQSGCTRTPARDGECPNQ